MGLLDWLFDLNRDGKVDRFDFALSMMLMAEMEKEDDGFDLDDDLEDF